MAKRTKLNLENVTAAQLKRMLVAKERLDELTATKAKLEANLAKIDKEIAKLLASGTVKAPRKKAGRKKVVKKTAKKRGRPKRSVEAKGASKKAAKMPAKKAPRKKAGTGAKLEDVVLQVIKASGGKLGFPEIRDTITSGKLYRSKSKNFDNVLRRTISTSKKVKRVSRGVYSAK